MKSLRRVHNNWRLAGLLLLLLSPLGCALPGAPMASINFSGRVYGQQVTASVPDGPVAAQISCNHHTTTASATGDFTLTVPLNDIGSYTCMVSAAPDYSPQTMTFAISKAGNYRLNFTTNVLGISSCQAKGSEYDCPILQYVSGKIVATLTYHDSKRPVPNAHVRCATQYGVAPSSVLHWFFSTSDAQGNYVVALLPPGSYTCIAYDPDFVVLPVITVHPAQMVAAQASICELHCPQMRYHDGVVLHAVTAYLIYWLPTGRTFDPARGSAHYEQATAQFITDVSGTPYYNVLTQYGDFAGAIQNHVTLGGSYVDTSPYLHAGTRAEPLTDADIQNEITRAQAANSTWKQTNDSIFVVFTGYNSEECSEKDCSFDRVNGFCGYHDTENGANYALILDTATCADGGTTPNDVYSDAAIDFLAHEIAETATDPRPFSGWNDDAKNTSVDGGEIGDLCEENFFSTLADGGNITLHGHDYFIQPLWSNKANGCAYSG